MIDTDERLLSGARLKELAHRAPQGGVWAKDFLLLLAHIEAQAERIEALEAGLAAAHAELRR